MLQLKTQRVAPHHSVPCPDLQEGPPFFRAEKGPPKNRVLLLLAFQDPGITVTVKKAFSSFSVERGNPGREERIHPSLE